MVQQCIQSLGEFGREQERLKKEKDRYAELVYVKSFSWPEERVYEITERDPVKGGRMIRLTERGIITKIEFYKI